MNNEISSSKKTQYDYDVERNVKHFNRKYDDLIKADGRVVPYDPKFANGTGYFDPIVTTVDLAQGEEATMVDEHGRRCILIGTLFGTVIVFQRYANREDLWGCNYPQELRRFGLYHGTTGIRPDETHAMDQMLGDLGMTDNVGKKLRSLLESAKAMKYVNGLQHAEVQNGD